MGETETIPSPGAGAAADAEVVESKSTEAAEAIELAVADDHVTALTKTRKPVLALEELIWNSLDADATNVIVEFGYNGLDGLERIIVRDDGVGIDPKTCDQSFGLLGGSPKRFNGKTPSGRTVHGKEGKGRFRAFALGSVVEWVSRYEDGNIVKEWSIRGDLSHPKRFPRTIPRPAPKASRGTTVTVSNPTVSPTQLSSDVARTDLLIHLAPYLRSYPTVKVALDGKTLDANSVVECETEIDLTADVMGQAIPAKLKIIEWTFDVDRRLLLLCTSDGFARYEEGTSIHAKGFDFTAYVMSDVITRMSETELSLGELEPRIRALADAAKVKMREHFKAREAERWRALVEQWKEEGSYPYEGDAKTPLAQVEREVFEILAVNVHQRLPGFDVATKEGKEFTFKLLRQALETNPSSLQSILKEVLKLPKQEQDDFAEMLQRTKLSGIVRAAKVVTDRMQFLAGLKDLLFDPVTKKLLKERSQLQRILVDNLWVFGEAYNLGLDDQDLKALLAAHLKILGREQIAEDVKDINDEKAIPDLMLYRQYPERREGQFEHLVVELKRPSVKAGQDEIGQIQRYAFSVQADQRFDKERTRWTFVLVVNDVDGVGDRMCVQTGREYGHVYQSDNVDVFVRKWSSVLQDCQWRHDFYRKQLELEIQDGDGRAFLEKKHAHLLPAFDRGPKATKEPARKTAKPGKAAARH